MKLFLGKESNKKNIIKLLYFLGISLFIGCGEAVPAFKEIDLGEADLISKKISKVKEIIAKKDKTKESVIGSGTTMQRGDKGNATEIEQIDRVTIAEFFDFGNNSASPSVDYLIVLDNSCSMDAITEAVKSGFLSLLDKNVLPERSQVAVMSTLTASDDNFNITGRGIAKYDGIDAEPGFLDFINKSAIDNFKANSSDFTDQFPLNGCENKWFSPNQTNPAGNFCLESALQTAKSCLGAEAGILAFKQLLEKYEMQLFRSSSILNVIFVSDTHDPGVNNLKLMEATPDYTDLVTATNKHNILAGINFHALAPDSKCTDESLHNKTYYTLAAESRGYTLDPCIEDDYSEFMHQMVTESQSPNRAVFTVSQEPQRILSIHVDGMPWEDYQFLNTRTIEVKGLDAEERHQIEIIYEF